MVSPGEAYLEAIRKIPEGWNVEIKPRVYNDGKEVVALADSTNKTVTISEKEVRKNTALHEVVHAHLYEIRDTNPLRFDNIITDAKKAWNVTEADAKKQGYTADELAEELLADELKYYAEHKAFKTKGLLGTIKEFLIDLWNRIKGLVGNDDTMRTLYNDILGGKKKYKASTRQGKMYERMKKAQSKSKDIATAREEARAKKESEMMIEMDASMPGQRIVHE